MQTYVKVEGLDELKERLSEKYIKASIKSAMNRAGRAAFTEASKSIREKFNIKKADLDKHMGYRLNQNALGATISADRDTFPLYKFGGRRVGRGVSVEVIKGQRKKSAHTFYAVMKSGHVGAFIRLPGGTAKSPARRVTKGQKGQRYGSFLPIQERMGPSVGTFLKKDYTVARIARRFNEVFKERFAHEYGRRLSRSRS
jgi:hypothetical protein